MEKIKIAWIGEESKFSKKLMVKLLKTYESSEVSYDIINIEQRNLKLIFSNFPEVSYQLIFLDFTQNAEYKVDLCKIIQKYEYLQDVKIVGVLNEQHNEIFYSDFLSLPIDLYTVKKIDIDEILEDLSTISNNNQLENAYFSTPGFDEVMWIQVPCKANYQDGKLKIYSPLQDFQDMKNFKVFLKDKEKENGFEYDDVIKDWIKSKDTDVSLSFKTDSDKEIFLKGSSFSKADNSFKVQLDKKSIKNLGKSIDLFRVANDPRKRVLIFDQSLSLFEKCWEADRVNKKINMFNFPHVTKNFSIIESLAPELIIFRNVSSSPEENQGRIQNYLDILSATIDDEPKPFVIVFNCGEKITSEYEKLLNVPFDINADYLDNILKLLSSGKALILKGTRIELDNEVHYWKNSRLKNVIYLNLPVYIQDISEKVVKLKCPFALEHDFMVYEKNNFGVFMLLFKDQNEPDPQIVSALFISESETKKTNIRKYTNYLNFKPKTLVQQEDYENFLELKKQFLINKDKAEKKKKDAESEVKSMESGNAITTTD
jgi:hypothetical protein